MFGGLDALWAALTGASADVRREMDTPSHLPERLPTLGQELERAARQVGGGFDSIFVPPEANKGKKKGLFD